MILYILCFYCGLINFVNALLEQRFFSGRISGYSDGLYFMEQICNVSYILVKQRGLIFAGIYEN